MRTYFQDFVRDNGLPITVEYGVEGSYSPTTYSPLLGADGGDAPEFCIVACWPNTPWHERLAGINVWAITRPNVTRAGASLARMLTAPVRSLMLVDEWWRASLTDAERERMEAWIAEHYVDDHDESDYY